MKLKLDENIGRRGIEILRSAGHDVASVREQGLQGVSDRALFEVCAAEQRVLITLDRGFGQVLRFSPEKGAGVVIIDAGMRVSRQALLDRLRDFLRVSEGQSLSGALWVVEAGRVRVHLRGSDG